MLCNVTVLKIHWLELLFKKVVNVPEYFLGGDPKNRKIIAFLLGEIKRHPMRTWLVTCIHIGDKQGWVM